VTVSFVGLSVSSPDGMGRGPVGSQAAPQFALAVPRRVGSAVVRNKVRRRLKEQLAVRQGDLEPGSYLVAVSAEAGRLGFSELAAALDEALEPFGRQNGKKSK
jgi:ribonuclease P protein component